MEKKLKWKVSDAETGLSLLSFLKEKIDLPLSNRTLKNYLEQGICKLNNKVETFASIKLKKNDLIELCERWRTAHKKGRKPEIIYEDSYFIMINKEVGLLCTDAEIQKIFPNATLVHRLDRETSGLLILAKSQKIKEMMVDLFLKKQVQKTYIAIVDKAVKENRKEIKSSVGLNKNSFGKVLWHSQKDGLFAHTIFEKIKTGNNYSVLLCVPVTGRTHQIRVHLNEWGHPILGDYKYAQKYLYSNFVHRLLLHSFMIEFIHPITSALLKIRAPLPNEFRWFVGKHEIFNN